MKWVLHLQSPHIAAQAVNDIFRADPLRDDAVLVSPNLDSVLSLVGRCVQSHATQVHEKSGLLNMDEDYGVTPPPDIVTMFCGKFSHRTLTSPSCPVRLCVDKLLRLVSTKKRVAGSSFIVCCALEAAVGKSIDERVPLEQRLVGGLNEESSSFDNLGLRFGPRQSTPSGFAELRTQWEWVSVSNAMLNSPSFRQIENRVSIRVRIAALALLTGDRYRVIQAFSFWYLSDLHCDEFVKKIVPTTFTESGPSLAVGAALLTSSTQVLQYGDVAQAIWDQLMPARQTEKQTLRRSLSQPDRTSSSVLSPRAVEQLEEELSIIEARRKSLLDEPQQFEASDVPSPVAAVELARKELCELGIAHDTAERRFSSVARKLSDEKAALERTQSSIEQCEKRTATISAALEQLAEEKNAKGARAAALSEERDRLASEIAATEAATEARAKEHRRFKAEQDNVIANELRRQEEELQSIHEQHLRDVAQERQAIQVEMEHYSAEREKKINLLEQRLQRMKDDLVVENSALSEASEAAVAAQTEVLRAKREAAEVDAQAAMLAEKHEMLHEGHGSLTERLMTLRLEETSSESALAAVTAEQQRLSAWLTTHDEEVNAQESLAEAKLRESSEFQNMAGPRFRQQQLLFVHALVRLESKERERVEASQIISFCELLQNEPLKWFNAMQAGEVFFHERSHSRMRDALIESNKDITETLSRVSLAMRQAEEFSHRMEGAEEAHHQLMGNLRGQLGELKEEETRFRERTNIDGELDLIEALSKRLEERTNLLRKCLISAPIGDPIRTTVPAVKSPGIVRPTSELMQRLARLKAHSAGGLDVVRAEEAVQTQKLGRLERELEERTAISSRVRESIWEADRNVAAAEDIVEGKRTALKEMKEKHEALRQQLKEEFIYAQEVTARHRVEVQDELQKQREEHEALLEMLHRTEKELKGLRLRRDELRRRNTCSNEATLILELQRELSRQAKLRDAVRQELGYQ